MRLIPLTVAFALGACASMTSSGLGDEAAPVCRAATAPIPTGADEDAEAPNGAGADEGASEFAAPRGGERFLGASIDD